MRQPLVFFLGLTVLLLCVFPARAEDEHACLFVEALGELPGELERLRLGEGSVRAFEVRLSTMRDQLGDIHRAILFNPQELNAMRQYLEAIAMDWDQFGTNRPTRNVVEPFRTTTDTDHAIAFISAKFKCGYVDAPAEAQLKSVDMEAINLVLVLAIVSGLLLVICATRIALGRGRRDKRMICRVPAYLTVDGVAHATEVVNISRGGVMVVVPDEDLDSATVTLDLKQLSILSKIVWTNKNFAGLAFERKISMQMVEEVAKSASPQPALGQGLVDRA